MPTAKGIGMHRHLMNLLPILLACAPFLFAVAMSVLALTTILPRLAGTRGAVDDLGAPRRLTIPYRRISRDGR
jgi:hypothetical protein